MMFESSSKNRKSWDGRQMIRLHSRYPKQQMKMIWRLPWCLTVYWRTFPFWEHDFKKNFWVVLKLRKKRLKSSDERRKDLQENHYTSLIIILDNFTQFSQKGEKFIFSSFFSSSNATIKAEMEKVFEYIFFRYICVLSIYEKKLMKIFCLLGGVETYM